MIRTYLIIPLLALIFNACSGKTQINPDPEDYDNFSKEAYFYEKKNKNKELEESYNRGKNDGYDDAKKEFEKIIPYLEAIRASAELANSGGLCYGPLFLDKSDPAGMKVMLGNAHICDNFTVDRILKIVKSGIPGLPETMPKTTTSNSTTTSVDNSVSTVGIAGMKEQDYFIEKPEEQKNKETVKVKVKDTMTNRQILRESSTAFSSVELDTNDKNFMIIQFNDSSTMNNFCNKFSICVKG